MSTPTQDSALPPPPPPPGAVPLDLAALQAAGFPGFPADVDGQQIMQILKNLPQFGQIADGQVNKEAAAQALSNLALYQQGQFSDPGPSSHPHGPPPPGYPLPAAPMTAAPAEGEDDEAHDGEYSEASPVPGASGRKATGGRRGRGGAQIGTEEWSRQRKDNHKEVERRRRGNINEGIDELGRIVPNGSGEKSKGAILARAVQYIHHLKENEARNIEKWTLEKLLMDQAMGDLQVQLDEIRRMWEEERAGRARAEAELQALRGTNGAGASAEKRASPESEADGSQSKKARTDES